MTLEFYRIVHLLGFSCLFLALGGMANDAMTRLAAPEDAPLAPKSKVWGALHGIGLLVLLVAGFGAMAKLGIKAPPGWVWAKLVLWLALGASPALFKRKPQLALYLTCALPFAALGAAALAILQPGG